MANVKGKVYRAPWEYDIPPFHMVDNLYYVGNDSVSVHLFDTGEGLLLLDTAYAETVYMLIESIREMGFDPHDIRWIVHSHGHIDHFGGTRMLAEKYGCKTYLPAADLDHLEDADLAWCAQFGMRYEPPYDTYFKPDVLINPGDVIKFGNVTMTAYSAAGHTPGTMAYVFDMPGGLKAGTYGGIGINTLQHDFCIRHNTGNTWREAYRDSLKRLRGLKVDVMMGNHPYQTDTFDKLARRTPENNTFIDPTEWDRFIDKTSEWFEAEMAKLPPL